MPRPPRTDVPGAWHHVMNRGVDFQAIFRDDNDRRTFLSLLAEAALETGIECHAFCLMGNHYHLLVRSPDGNLGEAVWLQARKYVRYFNDRYGRDGPLFRGRYKAIFVDADRYLLGVSRYIHRNPLGPGLVDQLIDYRWSSYRSYVGLRNPPSWLHVDFTLAVLGGSADAYRSLVETRIPSDPIEQFYDRQRLPNAIDV